MNIAFIVWTLVMARFFTQISNNVSSNQGKSVKYKMNLSK